MNRKYFIFVKSHRTYEKIKNWIKLNYVWDDLRGAGWTTTISLSREELRTLKVKLWNCKYQLLRIR